MTIVSVHVCVMLVHNYVATCSVTYVISTYPGSSLFVAVFTTAVLWRGITTSSMINSSLLAENSWPPVIPSGE